MEFLIIVAIFIFVVIYRNYKGKNVYKFIVTQAGSIYDKYAPYSFKVVREKTKQLGEEYTPRQYMMQVAVFSIFAAVVTYLYFYNLIISIIYILIVNATIPYLAYLRCKRVYSEFVFEQIQVYTTNTIMEFATTESFVKALEGVASSGVLEDPVLSDVQEMISMAYENGSIDASVEYMNQKYPFYIVKNMHQLFLQITKEGANDAGESLDNMQLDIDMLVESVYRDRMERSTFHKSFLKYGVMLYLLVMLVQYMLGRDTYLQLIDNVLVVIILHLILIINSFFLIKGEKYYNENVGGE